MRTRLTFLIACSTTVSVSVAQIEQEQRAPLPVVCDVFLLPGGHVESDQVVGLAEWRSLVPRSELLKFHLGDHAQDGSFENTLGATGSFAGAVSFRLGSPMRVDRSGAYLRVGFTYQRHGGSDLRLRKETRTPFDTLTSSQTGAGIVIDSVTISRYDLRHDYRSLALDASVVFMKQYPGRWTLYGGGGVQLGLAFDGRAQVRHTIDRRTDPSLSANGTASLSDERASAKIEQFRTKDDLCLAVYTPLGVSFRLGSKRPFWRALNLCYELRPTLAFGGVPELRPGARAIIGQYFGLRVDLVN